MNYSEEFQTVDLIISSPSETRAVDAFALSLIKTERQVRKLVTHLIYQFACFGPSDVVSLRETLGRNRRVYFEGFERGFDALYLKTVRALVGPEYDRLRPRIIEAIEHRNKIFHGQLTSNSLSREDLLKYVTDIRTWCETLASNASTDFQYDGFGRNSFRKSAIPKLYERFKVQLVDTADYERFIQQYMQRP